MTDIVERLRKIADASRKADETDIPLGEQLREAATEIERLRAALKPFADFAPSVAGYPDDCALTQGSSLAKRQLTFGDLRNARSALDPRPLPVSGGCNNMRPEVDD